MSYHSTPGLGMDHYFYSPWYEWPIIKKPMWYFSTGFAPEGTGRTILSFGNPAVWWTGGAAMIALLLLLCRRVFFAVGLIAPRAPRNVSDPERPAAGEAGDLGALPERPAEGFGALLKRLAAGFNALRERLTGVFTAAPPADDPVPALIIISFLAQYLPWVLVSRGTYIYHYFPSVPFIILALVFFICRLEDRRRRAGRVVLAFCLLAALVLFIAFFPYISGVTASKAWLDSMKWFQGWLYY